MQQKTWNNATTKASAAPQLSADLSEGFSRHTPDKWQQGKTEIRTKANKVEQF